MELGAGALGGLGIDVADRHLHAPAGQRGGDRAADAAPATGDGDDLPSKRHGWASHVSAR